MSLLFALLACSEPPTLQVQVLDPWKKPVAGATLREAGLVESWTTGSDGVGHVPAGSTTVEILAAKEGYIPAYTKVEIPEGAEELPKVSVLLYKKAPQLGFFGIGPGDYVHFEGTPIEVTATEISEWHGVRNMPQALLPKVTQGVFRVLFHASLRPSELKQQDLSLSRLKFVESAEVVGLLGPQLIDLDLWVADADIPYEIVGLQSRDHYLIQTKDVLPPGVYAFHAQGILHSTEAKALDKLPREMKVAYIFEVR